MMCLEKIWNLHFLHRKKSIFFLFIDSKKKKSEDLDY